MYTATENTAQGWTLTDITCKNDTIAPNSSDAGSTATFNAQSGETITCVFTNTKEANVTIVKDAQSRMTRRTSITQRPARSW